MQKSDTFEEKSKTQSKRSTPKKRASLSIIKSPLKINKSEHSNDYNSLYKNRFPKNSMEKDNIDVMMSNSNLIKNKALNIQQFKKKKMEKKIFNNFANRNEQEIYIKNNLRIENNIENSNALKLSSELNEKLKRNITSNSINKNVVHNSRINHINNSNPSINNANNSNCNISNNVYENTKSSNKNIDILNVKIESNKTLNLNSNNQMQIMILENNKSILPPNNLNSHINDISILEKKIKNEENILNSKYEPNNINSNLEELDYLKLSNSKKKKEWKSWSLSEKELFYEAIANGANYTSLQKLFKNMNDVKFFKFHC